MESSAERTGAYDVGFFRTKATVEESGPRPVCRVNVKAQPIAREEPEQALRSLQHLADARVGLGLFLDEATQALERNELTVDQRLHVATIVSFIEGLAGRLDRIRVPGFVQKRHEPENA